MTDQPKRCALCEKDIPPPGKLFSWPGYEGPCPRPHYGAAAGFCSVGMTPEEIAEFNNSFEMWQNVCPGRQQMMLLALEGLIERLEQKGYARTREDLFILQELARPLYDKLRPDRNEAEIAWISKSPRDPEPPEGTFFRDLHKRNAVRAQVSGGQLLDTWDPKAIADRGI